MESVDNAIAMKEAKFELDEMFFSITEYDSTIVSGNKTFVRISGYEESEIIGRFHNIIRHEDMPRVVFKVFWDYLKADRPVVAFVKNKTKQGSYYWVFAVVFPLNGQYISIRIKPSTQIFAAVKEIYFKLIMAEAKHGADENKDIIMIEQEKLLSKLLNEAGFRDYDHFMNEALLSELLERKRLLLEKNDSNESSSKALVTSSNSKIASVYNISSTLLNSYSKWFEKIELFSKIKSAFKEKSFKLSSLARDIVLLSLNASVASYKLEVDGETFGVLASDIRMNAKENEVFIKQIREVSKRVSESLNDIIFLVSYISLQMEMVTYFIKELLESENDKLDKSVDTLYELVYKYNTSLMKLPLVFDKEIKKSISNLEGLEQQVMYLGYVQIYGIIEASRMSEDKLGFAEIFSQLKALIANTSDEITIMKNQAEEFYSENSRLINESRQIEKKLCEFKEEISSINNEIG